MNFLPIVERELRVAARRPGTYWLRFGVALIAAGIWWGIYQQESLWMSIGPSAVGPQIFLTLQHCALPTFTLLGVLLTADALSEEKREGTLGLLFLTDLRGRDVVLGKLAAHAARGLWAGLAVLPVTALTLVVGGISATWFLRAMLVIGNSLFLSLTLGLLASAVSRSGSLAAIVSLLGVGFLQVGVCRLDWWLASGDVRNYQTWFSLLSPAHLLAVACLPATGRPVSAGAFWGEWCTQNALAWTALAGAVLVLPRSWQQRSRGGAAAACSRWVANLYFGSALRRSRLRRDWLDRNPVGWLMRRDRRGVLALVAGLGVTAGLTCGWVRLATVEHRGDAGLEALSAATFLGWCALPFWAAAQAVGFFADLRRSGAGELLLVATVTPEQFLKAQQQAAKRTTAGVIALLFVLEAFCFANKIRVPWANPWQELWGRSMEEASVRGEPAGYLWGGVAGAVLLGNLTMVTSLLAVCALGRWFGLAGRKPLPAVGRAIVLGQMLPASAMILFHWLWWQMQKQSFAYLMGISASHFLPKETEVILSLELASLGIEIWIIRWANEQVRDRMRTVVAEGGSGFRRPAVERLTGARKEAVVSA